MVMHRALQVCAGPRALKHLRERGLQPDDVRVIPAAAGGPKGLIRNPLDRYLFGHWLQGSTHTVHLLGASIGAWRVACAMLMDADAALAALAQGYIHQEFNVPAGQRPGAAEVSRDFAQLLQGQFGGQEATLLAHPRFRLRVFTSRGRGPLLHHGARWATPLGHAAAFASNLVRRRALGGWLQRVVVSDPQDALPFYAGGGQPRPGDPAQWLDPVCAATGAPHRRRAPRRLLGRRHHRLPPAPALCRHD